MTEILVDDELEDGEVFRFIGPGFWPPWSYPGGAFILGNAFVASLRTLGDIMAHNLAEAHRPEGVP